MGDTMSYNVDTTDYLSGSLTMTVAECRRLASKYDGDLPECCFLDLDEDEGDGLADHNIIEISAPDMWSGSGSGRALIDKPGRLSPMAAEIFAATRGEADILFTWEGGDSFTGLRVRDGVVTFHEVEMKLGKEITC